MFLLLLMGLGAASVKAQVRIGGNAAPNAAAVLDLNAADATNNGTKGLALPRVNLTSNTMLLSGVTSNLSGMIVYNTTANSTIGTTIGIYFWNGANWVRANLPSTSAADSGKLLISNGQTFTVLQSMSLDTNQIHLQQRVAMPVTLTLILDTIVHFGTRSGTYQNVYVQGLTIADICFASNSSAYFTPYTTNGTGYIKFTSLEANGRMAATNMRFRCYRPSA